MCDKKIHKAVRDLLSSQDKNLDLLNLKFEALEEVLSKNDPEVFRDYQYALYQKLIKHFPNLEPLDGVDLQ